MAALGSAARSRIVAAVWQSAASQMARAWMGSAVLTCCQAMTATSNSNIRTRVRRDTLGATPLLHCSECSWIGLILIGPRGFRKLSAILPEEYLRMEPFFVPPQTHFYLSRT